MSSYATHEEILCRGATAWNTWREQNPSAVPDLKGVSLALREDLLNGANLREARLQNSVLRFAALSMANLEAADMSGADLMHAQLDHANLSAVNLSNARLDHAHLASAILTNANLRRARLRFTTLSTADLQAVDMSDADLMHARLDQADLSAANFNNARLDYADFAGAKLSKVNLCGACLRHAKNLTRSQLEGSTLSVSTILPPHLQGSVPWSPVLSPRIERYGPMALPRMIAGVDDAHLNSCNPQRNLYDPQRWAAAAVVPTAALVLTAFIWQCATMLDGQWKPWQSTTESIFLSEALTKTKSASDNPANAIAIAKTVDQTSLAEKQTKKLGEATISTELGATIEPQASTDRWPKAWETNEPDPTAHMKANEDLEALVGSTPLALVPTPPAARPHAIVPNLSSKALASSDVDHSGSLRQEAVSFGPGTPPNPPARNPRRGQDIDTAAIPSNAAMPPMPIRNPLR